ncbi:photosynthetic complex putative assembly protein PuhB [Methylobacterium sp. 77]|uniref:photosynthetic complex putative assembly protein PuhB n=1 Tax=Methylobacterium sp. 77 TaxID=1101192 RepID=UPI000364AE69|nr:photosynthetic complex putative assembly protein PuhB [Methylobacterium sp. 77]
MSRTATSSLGVPANAFDAPPGLPAPLPAGEHILWQGSPCGFGIAVRALHVRLVGIWFVGLALWAAVPPLSEGAFVQAALLAGPTLLVGIGAVALLGLLGWLSARSTTYTITNRRVVMRLGIALPMTLNLPFSLIEGAGCKVFADGSGDLPLQLRGGNRVAYLHLWPHARPWALTKPEPMMRSIPDAKLAAGILARALSTTLDTTEESAAPMVVARQRPVRPPRLANAS